MTTPNLASIADAATQGEKMEPYIHIHAPQPAAFGIDRNTCPTCEKRSYMVWTFTEWYGSDHTCLRCGEAFTEEGRSPRPFAPKWRERSKEAARKRYRRLRAAGLADGVAS